MLRLSILALLLIPLAACNEGAASATGVVGSWQDASAKSSLEIVADGTFTMDTKKGQHITGTWTLTGDKLSLTGKGAGGDVEGGFDGTLKGGEIHLQFGPMVSVYHRK
jgi:hypothetical protein